MISHKTLPDLRRLRESVAVECKLAGERAGSGIPRIRQGWPGELRLTDSTEPYDQTRLELLLPKEASGGTVKSMGKSKVKDTLKSSVESSVESSEKILTRLRANGKLTALQLSENLGLTKRAVEKQFAALKAAGRIRRIGPNKGGRWEVME